MERSERTERRDGVIPGGPADVIAYAWFQIGYRPRSSVILIGLRGPRRRTGLVARVDLPPPRQRRACVSRLAAMVARAGDDAAVALIVVPGSTPQGLSTHRALSQAVREQVPRAGLSLLDVLAVGERSYRSYLCADSGCCPIEGFPLDDVLSSATAAQMVLEGRVLGAGESDLISDVIPDPEPLTGLPRRVRRPATPVQRREWLDRWKVGLTAAGRGEPPGEVGWLVPALEDVAFRDAVLVTLAAPEQPDPFDAPASAVDTVRPDHHVLRAGGTLLAAVARQAPAGRRAEALATLAWIGWWTGVGGRARLLAGLALADRPDHRLAGLIGQLLVGAVPPPWAEPDHAGEDAEWAEW